MNLVSFPAIKRFTLGIRGSGSILRADTHHLHSHRGSYARSSVEEVDTSIEVAYTGLRQKN